MLLRFAESWLLVLWFCQSAPSSLWAMTWLFLKWSETNSSCFLGVERPGTWSSSTVFSRACRGWQWVSTLSKHLPSHVFPFPAEMERPVPQQGTVSFRVLDNNPSPDFKFAALPYFLHLPCVPVVLFPLYWLGNSMHILNYTFEINCPGSLMGDGVRKPQ